MLQVHFAFQYVAITVISFYSHLKCRKLAAFAVLLLACLNYSLNSALSDMHYYCCLSDLSSFSFVSDGDDVSVNDVIVLSAIKVATIRIHVDEMVATRITVSLLSSYFNYSSIVVEPISEVVSINLNVIVNVLVTTIAMIKCKFHLNYSWHY